MSGVQMEYQSHKIVIEVLDMEITYELEAIIPVSNTLGEGVLWRPSDQTLWWTDIEEKVLYRLDWGQVEPREYQLPLRLGSFGFVDGEEDVLIAAFESGFAYFWPESGKTQWLYQPAELELGCGRRLNDGRVGPDGAFWAGSMLEHGGVTGGAAQTGFYRLNGYGKAQFIHGGLHISNGLCWSPDGREIYLADSPKSTIYHAEFDVPSGECGEFKVFAQTKDGNPDGAIVDSRGRYWSALWGGHSLTIFDRAGHEIYRIKLPVPQPTIPVFGGPELNHLIVTSALQDLNQLQIDKFPQSGNVLIYKTNVTGVVPNYYAGTPK